MICGKRHNEWPIMRAKPFKLREHLEVVLKAFSRNQCPDQTQITMGSILEPMARAYSCRKKSAISETTSEYSGWFCIVRGVPCICMMMRAELVSAMSGSISLSPRPPVTSFHNRGACLNRARATSDFEVSIENRNVDLCS